MNDMILIKRLAFCTIGVVAVGLAASLSLTGAQRHASRSPIDDVGMVLAPSADPPGIVVESLRDRGRAERAGLRVGDRIEAIDGRAAASVRETESALLRHAANDVWVRRGDRRLELTI